jgi:hypothetical protein
MLRKTFPFSGQVDVDNNVSDSRDLVYVLGRLSRIVNRSTLATGLLSGQAEKNREQNSG